MFQPSTPLGYGVLVGGTILLFVVVPIFCILLYWMRMDEDALLRDIKAQAEFERLYGLNED